MTGWWGSLSDQDEVLLVVFEAGLLLLVLSVAAAYGTWRLRRRRSEEDDQPFWRRAAVAGAIVLLWILPVVVPIAFLYGLVAETHQLPERVDWLLYSTAQSIIIVLAVSVLVISAFAPRVPHWRLIPVSDRTARRICGLLLALAIVYGVTTLLYMVTRVAQAPFALTVAVALPSSLLVGRDHRGHPSYAVGGAAPGPNPLTAPARRAAGPCLDCSHRDRHISACRVLGACSVSRATTGRDGLHYGVCLPAAAVGRWTDAGLGRRPRGDRPLAQGKIW